MKTAHELWIKLAQSSSDAGVIAIEARDAEWRTEVTKLQDDLLQAANREVALEASLNAVADGLTMVTKERDRLKGELARYELMSVRRSKELVDMQGELAEARRLLERVRSFPQSATCPLPTEIWDAIWLFLAAPSPTSRSSQETHMSAPSENSADKSAPDEFRDAWREPEPWPIPKYKSPPAPSPAESTGVLAGWKIEGQYATPPADVLSRLADHERRLKALEAVDAANAVKAAAAPQEQAGHATSEPTRPCAQWCGKQWGLLPLDKPNHWFDQSLPVSSRHLFCSEACLRKFQDAKAAEVAFIFYADAKRFEHDRQFITGVDIKRLANASDHYQVFLEGVGHEPDRPIPDSIEVDISGREKHFYIVPPATFAGAKP